MDLMWTIVSFVLTLLILSFIFGDNPLFRVAAYLFVGVSAGYATVQLVYQVLWPLLVVPIISDIDFAIKLLYAVPLGLGLLLIFRLVPSLSRVGNLSIAYLVGVAAAVAIGGAVTGTLLGQTRGTINAFNLTPATGGATPADWLANAIGAVIMAVGTISTLIYFQFSARSRLNQVPKRPLAVEILARFGQVFIAITLGALFAGVIASALTALIERFGFIIQTTYLIK
jgi:hypothetical protein